MATAIARRLASRIDREQRRLETIGEREMRGPARLYWLAVRRIYLDGGGGDLPAALAVPGAAALDVILQAMTAAALQGMLRSRLIWEAFTARRKLALAGVRAPLHFAVTPASGSYARAIDFLRRRQGLSVADVTRIAGEFGNEAVNVMRGVSAGVEAAAKRAIEQVVASGAHVREGVQVLRAKLAAAGVEQVNPWLLETLVRTQTHIAYSAARQAVNADPAIAEILWGYEYTTVGDDRVRPNHAELDGMRMPVSDPRWNKLMPPNGFNCRCTVIEIFTGEGRRQTPNVPPDPKADKGFDFNPAQVQQSGALPVPPVSEPIQASRSA